MQYPEFVEFTNASRRQKNGVKRPEKQGGSQTPEELLEMAFEEIQANLANELLDKVKAASPAFFEKLVLDLLLEMGYGGSRRDAGRALGGPGDEGIDGVISQDKLGLEKIYIQAKKWDQTDGRPEIQKFVGALTGQRSRKGIFITTSIFSKEAYDYVDSIETKVVLIDGDALAKFLVDHEIAVTMVSKFEIKNDRDRYQVPFWRCGVLQKRMGTCTERNLFRYD